MRSQNAAPACFHCGLPSLDSQRRRAALLGAVREFCSADCERVARAIVDADSGAYYQTREPPRAESRDAPLPADTLPLSLYDEPAAQRQFVTTVGEHRREALLIVEGVSCGACVRLIERHLRALKGVVRIDVNAATRRAIVAWDERDVRLGQILEAVRAIGYGAAAGSNGAWCGRPHEACNLRPVAIVHRRRHRRSDLLYRVRSAGALPFRRADEPEPAGRVLDRIFPVLGVRRGFERVHLPSAA